MKLIRFGPNGQEKPGILDFQDKRLDVSGFGEDYEEAFFQNDGIDRLAKWLETNRSSCPTVDENQRWAAPVVRPSKIICVGLNYAPHAKESNMELPKEPILFFKATTALCGPYDEVIIPHGATKVDWEVELAVVIGKRTNNISEKEALSHVAGYSILNDVSERHFQLEQGGQWVKGKSADTFGPLGPWLVTQDEIEDVSALDIWLSVNDEEMQRSNTREMIFGVDRLVSYISQYMTLQPGDIISTGTPFGVGMGLNPQRYLKAGDSIRLGIDGLGVQEQQVVAWAPK